MGPRHTILLVEEEPATRAFLTGNLTADGYTVLAAAHKRAALDTLENAQPHFRAQGRTRTVDTHACRLRRKLADASGVPLVETVWGVGYRLIPIDGRHPSGAVAYRRRPPPAWPANRRAA